MQNTQYIAHGLIETASDKELNSPYESAETRANCGFHLVNFLIYKRYRRKQPLSGAQESTIGYIRANHWSHMRPIPISYATNTNLICDQYQSHMRPVPISYATNTNFICDRYQSHMRPVPISCATNTKFMRDQYSFIINHNNNQIKLKRYV